MQSLKNKVAIVCGASAGIGRAAALLFAREGAELVVCARRKEELDTLVEEIHNEGGRAIALVGDVQHEQFAAQAVALAEHHFGGLDIALNNAATMGELAPTIEMTLHNWNRVMSCNAGSAFLAAKHQIPAMLKRGGGSLIFTGSFVGHTASFPGMAAYAASKAALVGLTQTLATEYGKQGVRVNALLPGATDTAMGRSFANTREIYDFVRNLNVMNAWRRQRK